MLNVVQFGHDAQIDALIRKSQFEIDSSRHYVLLSVINDPYIGNSTQVHRVEKEWELVANIALACLEEASRLIEERVDQKRCLLEFKWMTKFPINGATMSYGYLST